MWQEDSKAWKAGRGGLENGGARGRATWLPRHLVICCTSQMKGPGEACNSEPAKGKDEKHFSHLSPARGLGPNFLSPAGSLAGRAGHLQGRPLLHQLHEETPRRSLSAPAPATQGSPDKHCPPPRAAPAGQPGSSRGARRESQTRGAWQRSSEDGPDAGLARQCHMLHWARTTC